MRTTTLNIFVDILQRLRDTKAEVGINTTMEMDESIGEDDEGNEILLEAGPSEVFFMIEDKIEVDEEQHLVVDDEIIEDIEDALFEAHASIDTDIKGFCALLNELADAGYGVQTRVGEEDVLVLDVEHLDEKEGLRDIEKLLSRGKLKILYIPFDAQGLKVQEVYQMTENVPSYHDFLLWYNKEEAHYRLYPQNAKKEDIEDALDYYKNVFVPMIHTARRNGEIPGLIFR